MDDTTKELIGEMENGARLEVFKTDSSEIFLPADNYDEVEGWAADVLAAAFQYGLTGNDIDRLQRATTLKVVV